MTDTTVADAPELPDRAPAPAIRIVNLTEMAELLGITTPTLREWVRRFDVPIESRGSHGTAYEFDVLAVKAWQEQHQAKLREEAEQRQAQLRQQRLDLFGDDIDDDPTVELSPTERRAEIEAQKAADLLRLARGELLRRADVDAQLRVVLAELTKGLRQLGPDLAREHGLDRELRIAIDASTRRLFNAVIDRCQDLLAEERDADAA